MPEILEVLTASRAEVEHLAAALRDLRPVGPDMPGDDDRRRQVLLRRLRRALIGRETLVQRYLVPAVRRAHPDGAATADRLLAEKVALEAILVRMPWFHQRDPVLNDMGHRLLTGLEQHLDLEQRVLAELGTAMPPADRDELARRIARGPRWTPTRPHPDTPPSPRVATVLSPLVAALDRLRDLLEAAPSGS